MSVRSGIKHAQRLAAPLALVEPGAVGEVPETDPFRPLLPAGSEPIEAFAPGSFNDDVREFVSDGLASDCVILPLCRPRLLPPGPAERQVVPPPTPGVSVPVQLPVDPPAHCAAAKVAGAATSIKANAARSMVFCMISFPEHQPQLERIARWPVP